MGTHRGALEEGEQGKAFLERALSVAVNRRQHCRQLAATPEPAFRHAEGPCRNLRSIYFWRGGGWEKGDAT